jgi:uncharacterized protein (DUF433 family)
MRRQTDRDPYRGRNPREIPAYNSFDAAHYLRMPENTIRNWAFGYMVPTRAGGQRQTKPLIQVADRAGHAFSFFNLVELHVLRALRREYRVEMIKIRRAIEFLQERLNCERPLITEEMETDGTNIFVTKVGKLINVSAEGQLAMKELLHAYLRRIDRDEHGIALRLFPFTSGRELTPDGTSAAPRVIAIDPAVAYGRPVIVGSRVPTTEVFQRFNAGESPDELAADFGRTTAEILEAVRCENAATAA